MTKLVFICSAIGFSILTAAGGPWRELHADETSVRERVDGLVQPYLDNKVVVGMTIGVLNKDRLEVFGYGRMSRDDGSVPDGKTIYELGSVTKVFTGLLLADAVVQGRVKLDQPARELLSSDVTMPNFGDRAITLRDLSTHVSGLPRLPDNMKFTDPNNPYADYHEQDLYAFLNHHKLQRAPGTKVEYSNLGAGLLGHLLSLEAKTTYEELVRTRIAEPLRMTSTKIQMDAESRILFSPGHRADGEPAAHWDLPVLAGAGGFRTTVDDMLLFAIANLAPPKDQFGEAIEMAWSVQQKPIKAGDVSLGLGWHLALDGTRWHNGETGGYHSMILINRPLKSSVVVMTNTATSEVDQLATDILKMVCGVPVAPRKFEKPIDVSAETLQKYVGNYQLAPGVQFTVETKGDKLMIALTGQPSYQVFARSETVWYYKVVEATITFHLNKDGECDSLVLFQNGIKQTAKRKK